MAENQTINLKKPLDNLIFDRTTNDIVEGNKKGYYNYNDLNRIEIWCRYLSDYLNNYNYSNTLITKTNWIMSDLPYNAELERIRNNIQILKNVFQAISEIPQNLNLMTIEKANIIENILYEIDYILCGMENDFTYCGVSECGQERLWQQKFRKQRNWNTQSYKLSQYTENDTLKTISAPNNKNVSFHTSKLQLTQIDKRDDVYSSVNDLNMSFQSIDNLVGFECDYYEVRNIIADSSFENDIWNGANYSTVESLFDNRSLYFPVGTTIVATINVDRPILGHKYYGRRYIKTNGNNAPADCRFELFGGDGEGLNWVFAWNQGDYPNWNFESAIHEITSINYEETKQTIIRCFNVSTTSDTWIDGVMLIDLTEAFGIGKEPTKDWCDNNIPYFKDTHTIKIRKES